MEKVHRDPGYPEKETWGGAGLPIKENNNSGVVFFYVHWLRVRLSVVLEPWLSYSTLVT